MVRCEQCDYLGKLQIMRSGRKGMVTYHCPFGKMSVETIYDEIECDQYRYYD